MMEDSGEDLISAETDQWNQYEGGSLHGGMTNNPQLFYTVSHFNLAKQL